MPLAGTFSPANAQAQSQCEKELAEAQAKYQIGLFDEAIDLLERCRKKSGLTAAEFEKLYWMLSKAYHAKDLLDNAKASLRKLLELVPGWRPNPEKDSPAFQELVQEVKKEMQEEAQLTKAPAPDTTKTETPAQPPPLKKGSGKKWLWLAGGGAVAAGTAAFVIFRGDEKAARLPDPPDLPRK
jgi:hypothetical protein